MSCELETDVVKIYTRLFVVESASQLLVGCMRVTPSLVLVVDAIPRTTGGRIEVYSPCIDWTPCIYDYVQMYV